MRYLLTIKYDGSKFNGFQRLKNNDSVQKKIEDALALVIKEQIKIKGAGRTDRGVHALGQCVHFDAELKMDLDKFKYVINNTLKPYIVVTDIKEVDNDFHARHSVKKKQYSYHINLGEYDPLSADYIYQPTYKIDYNMLKKVCKLFEGHHNFKNFVSGERDNYETTINKVKVIKMYDFIAIDFYGQGFYRYMVRSMVGAALEVAKGNATLNDIRNMLDHPEEKKILPVAPANGLYLEKIWY